MSANSKLILRQTPKITSPPNPAPLKCPCVFVWNFLALLGQVTGQPSVLYFATNIFKAQLLTDWMDGWVGGSTSLVGATRGMLFSTTPALEMLNIPPKNGTFEPMIFRTSPGGICYHLRKTTRKIIFGG